MWYEVPKEPPAPASEKPPAIFPWESHQPPASRVFWDEGQELIGDGSLPTNEFLGPPGSQRAEPSMTGSSTIGEGKSDPETPSTPRAFGSRGDIWSSFDRSNAWDEDPRIQRYARKLEEITQPRRVFTHVQRRGTRVTDFPSEYERPSLPVTPAPMRSHPKAWAVAGASGDGKLPAAEGVPSQAEWVCVHGRIWGPEDCLCDLTNLLRYYKDPMAQLEKLAAHQSEVLLKKFGGSVHEKGPAQSKPAGNVATAGQPSTAVFSPQPVKGAEAAKMARDMLERSVPAIDRSQAQAAVSSEESVPKPSYMGPGSAWERGESIPTSSLSMPITTEEQDVLQT